MTEGGHGLSRLVIATCAAGILAACNAQVGTDIVSDFEDLAVHEIEEAFRLGGPVTTTEQAFQREPQITVDQDGHVYALHGNLGRAAVFDPHGAFLYWVGGGLGEGPGEFTFPGRLGFVGDTLWVRNLSPPRISRFLREGSHLGDERVLVEVDYRTTMGIQGVTGYLQDGRAWLEPDGFVMSSEGPSARVPFVVGDRTMESRDTIFYWRSGRGRLAGTSFEPISEPPFHDVAPNGAGILFANWSESAPEDVQVDFFSPDGVVTGSWQLRMRAIPVPEAVRDSLTQAGREQIDAARRRSIEQGVPVEHAPEVPTADEVRATAYLPEHHPPIQGVLAGLDGSLWLRLADSRRQQVWVVLDPSGEAQFKVELPVNVNVREASQEAIWGTLVDELDVPYVVRWLVRDVQE